VTDREKEVEAFSDALSELTAALQSIADVIDEAAKVSATEAVNADA
jgi:hypothetical protein